MRIAFIGPIGSGKTTMAQTFQESSPGWNLNFASPLKDEVAEFILKTIDGDSVNKIPKTPHNLVNKLPEAIKREIQKEPRINKIKELMADRENKEHFRPILQWWGTDFRRKKNINYWIDQIKIFIETAPEDFHIYVDDCRFINEFEYLKANDFKFVMLEGNPDFNNVNQVQNHASEEDWKNFQIDMIVPWTDIEERFKLIKNSL